MGASPLPPLTEADRLFLLVTARRTLITFLECGERPEARADLPSLLQPRAAFVTLRHRDTKELRGCRGEIHARRPLVVSVVDQVIAAARDPRFPEVTREELPRIHIHISALTALERIRPEEVVLGRHGLLIVKGKRSGLLLPQVPALYAMTDRESFLNSVCRKARLPKRAWTDPEAMLFGFEAESWGEDAAAD